MELEYTTKIKIEVTCDNTGDSVYSNEVESLEVANMCTGDIDQAKEKYEETMKDYAEDRANESQLADKLEQETKENDPGEYNHWDINAKEEKGRI